MQRCSTEVFVETVLQSALLQGEMSHMVEQIQMLDPSLTKWMPYLTQSCRFLLGNRQFHVLYRVQLLMKACFCLWICVIVDLGVHFLILFFILW